MLDPAALDALGDGESRTLAFQVVAVDAPLYGPTVEHVPTRDAALDVLDEAGAGFAVLVKGSRVAGLEQVAHALLGEASSGGRE